MGRKFFTPVVVAAAILGMSAGPALAKTHANASFSTGAHKISMKAFKSHSAHLRSLAKADTPSKDSDVTLVAHGSEDECTAPNGMGYTNFFSRDTTVFSVLDGFEYVGTCTANLNTPQTGANAKDRPAGTVMVPFSGYQSYAEFCSVTVKGTTYYGDALSVSYKDGEFDETCVAADLF